MSNEARPTDAEPKQKPRRWRRLIVVMAISVVAIGWLLRPARPQFQFTTSDGSCITFLTAGLGKVDYRTNSNAYEWCYQRLRDYCPVVLFNQIPSPKSVATSFEKSRTGAEPLVLLFELQPNPVSGRRERLRDAVRIEFVDSNGHRFPGNLASMLQTADGFEGHVFESFPRRDPQLSIHLTDLSSLNRTASFEIPNPGFQADFPKWTAEKLPQTKSDSEVDVTLRQLRSDSLSDGKTLPLEVVARNPAWATNSIAAWIEDATGNHSNDLSPFEPAWKARILVARSEPASISPAEQWTIGPFALPAPGAVDNVGQTGQIGEASFKVSRLEFVRARVPASSISQSTPAAAPGSYPTPAVVDWTELQFTVELRSFPGHSTLITLVTDQDGEPLKEFKRIVTSTTAKSQWTAVRFPRKPNTTHVSLTLMVSRPKEFEFLIAPPTR